MKLIKAARVYRLSLPAEQWRALDFINRKPFRELAPSDFDGGGFTPVPDAGLVPVFEGGYAFTYRYDSKIVPGAAVKAETERRAAEHEAQYGYKLGRKARKELKEGVTRYLTLRALSRSQVVTCFYLPADKLLIVGTASKKLADLITSDLVRVFESIEATTIYVSSARHGLTARLQVYLGGDPLPDTPEDAQKDEAFQGFLTGDTCKLRAPEGRAVTVKAPTLYSAREGLLEAIAAGARVEEIALHTFDVDFRLTSDFVLKGMRAAENAGAGEQDFEDAAEAWRHTAGVEVLYVKEIVDALCALLAFKDEAEGTAPPLDGDLA